MDKFSAEAMQQIDSDLDALLMQDPPIKSNEELIGKYVVKMRAALEKGWPLEALIDILKKQGIEIQPNTLRSYIQRQKKKVEDLAVVAEAPTADTPAAAAATGKKKGRKSRKDKKAENNPDLNQSTLPGSDSGSNSFASVAGSGEFQLDSDNV